MVFGLMVPALSGFAILYRTFGAEMPKLDGTPIGDLPMQRKASQPRGIKPTR
jgi:hypothetical protein